MLLLLLLLLLLQVAKYKNSLEHKIRVSNVLSHPDLAHFRAALTGAAGEVEAPPSALPLVLLMLLLLRQQCCVNSYRCSYPPLQAMSLPDVELMLRLLESRKQQLAAQSLVSQKQLLREFLQVEGAWGEGVGEAAAGV